MAPKVGIVIPNYNDWEDTVNCLESLEKQTVQNFEVILLDDCSTNDAVERLERVIPTKKIPIVFIPQKENRGFSATTNNGMRRALADGADWVLLLNNDTLCAPDMIETLLRETPPKAVSCPKMLFMMHPHEIWFAGGRLDRKTGRVEHLGGHQTDSPAFSEKQEVNFITFCCVLLPRAAIEELGYLDETLFMYCEDVEYCIRLADAGYTLWYLPDAKLWHRAGASAGGMLNCYYVTRNTLYLTCMDMSPLRKKWEIAKVLVPGAARYLFTRLLRRQRGRSYGVYRGALDYAAGKMGRMETPPFAEDTTE